MLALYRAGRQTDALDVFRAARDRLVDELGLEPGPRAARAPAADPPARPDARRTAPRRRRAPVDDARRRRRCCGRRLALAAAVAALRAQLGRGHARRALPRRRERAAGGEHRRGRDRHCDARCRRAGSGRDRGAGSVWVADAEQRDGVADRSRIGCCRATGSRSAASPGASSAATGRSGLRARSARRVIRIDPTTGDGDPDDRRCRGQARTRSRSAQGRLWVADSPPVSCSRSIPRADRSRGRFRWMCSRARSRSARGAVWVAGYDNATVEKLDPDVGRAIGRVHVGNGPVALAFAARRSVGREQPRLDDLEDRSAPRSRSARRSRSAAVRRRSAPTRDRCGSPTSTPTPSRGSTRDANEVVGPMLDVGGSPTSLAPRRRTLWVGVAASGGSHRGGTLVTGWPRGGFASVDPAFFNVAEPPQFGGLAYDTLVTFQHTGGRRRSATRARPRARDPNPDRRRGNLRVPSSPADSLLRRTDRAGQRLPPRDRAPVPPRFTRQPLLRRASSAPQPARDSRQAAISREGSSPTTQPEPSSFT